MPRISILDTYYPDFLDNYPFNRDDSYEQALAKILYEGFGTGDFYSLNLRKMGWECQDIIVNATHLQNKWADERLSTPATPTGILFDQLVTFKPDVIFCQALGLIQHENAIRQYLDCQHRKIIVAGQCSCPVNRLHIPHYDVLFTSFPHYVPMFNHLGVRGIYNPLAFEPEVIQRVESRYGFPAFGNPYRPYDITFVGGVGTPSHWSSGMKFLGAVAKKFRDRAHFFGYGYEQLPMDSDITHYYQGRAWGLHMYRVYSKSKIVINRHGEVSQDYANNMRMYEATGMGAMLLTEAKTNLHHLFRPNHEVIPYQSIDDAIQLLEYYLEHDSERIRVADAGHAKTIAQHTYFERMELISVILEEML